MEKDLRSKSAVSKVVVAVICIIVVAAIAGAAYYATRPIPTPTQPPTPTMTATPTPQPTTVPSPTPSPVPTSTLTPAPSPAPSSKPTGKTVRSTPLTFKEMVQEYTHAKVVMKAFNSTTSETQVVSFEYTATKETLNGQQVIRLDLTYSEEGSEETVASLWITLDFQQVVQVKIGDNVVTGPYADTMGKQFLQTLEYSPLFAVTSSYDIQFHVVEGMAEAMKHGWMVDFFNPTQVAISGITYQGYHFKVTNLSDTQSDTKSVEGKLVEVNPGFYYLVYIYAVEKDGDTFQLELTELTPA